MREVKTFEIEKIVFGGKGLARLNGKIAFIDGVLPGEKIKAELIPSKHFFEGKVLEILSPSPQRIENDCKFKECGGCDFRHCTYKYELELKKSMLIDTLKRIGKTELDGNSIEMLFKKRNNYRIKTGFKANKGKIGFFKKKSHNIVDIDYCLQCPESVNSKLKKIRKGKVKKDFFLEIHPFEENVFFYFKWEKGEEIKLNFGKYTMFHRTGNFIQANRDLIVDFVNIVTELAGEGNSLLELYCGSGLFTLPVSFNYKKIYAYEHSSSAVEMLKKSIGLNGIKNVVVFELAAEDFKEGKYNTVLVDPPREGLSKVVREKIVKSNPEKIVYVSCNASTFARDLHYFSDKYTMERIVLIDNFPATAHFETAALLRRK